MYRVFFFKQKTAYEMRISDWSSDVCSSDLIFVSTHRADLLGDLDDPVARSLGGRLTIVPAADNLADSVLAVAGLAQFPLLITTADNCLLTPATIAEKIGRAHV